jgi:hypothetical protein
MALQRIQLQVVMYKLQPTKVCDLQSSLIWSTNSILSPMSNILRSIILLHTGCIFPPRGQTADYIRMRFLTLHSHLWHDHNSGLESFLEGRLLWPQRPPTVLCPRTERTNHLPHTKNTKGEDRARCSLRRDRELRFVAEDFPW